MLPLKEVAPENIESESFAIIEQEFYQRTGLDFTSLDSPQFHVIRRVIHATGDFSFANSLMFHPESIQNGISAIKAGKDVYCDVSMAAAGVNARVLNNFGGKVKCFINNPEIREIARRSGKTRSETALVEALNENTGIVAIGNAPTALIAVMKLIESKVVDPDLVIGVPVGFVNAEESKEILMSKKYQYISNRGRKGGTPVSVAIVNALLKLALE